MTTFTIIFYVVQSFSLMFVLWFLKRSGCIFCCLYKEVQILWNTKNIGGIMVNVEENRIGKESLNSRQDSLHDTLS